MPTIRRKKRGKAILGDSEFWELLLGPDGRGKGAFENEFLRRAAWNLHKDDLMAGWDVPGSRPWSWWKYDALSQCKKDETERQALERMKLITAEEKAKLDAWNSLVGQEWRP